MRFAHYLGGGAKGSNFKVEWNRLERQVERCFAEIPRSALGFLRSVHLACGSPSLGAAAALLP